MITQQDKDNLMKEIITDIVAKHGRVEEEQLAKELTEVLVRRDVSFHLQILVDNGIVIEEFDKDKNENVYSTTKDGQKKLKKLRKDKPEIFDCIYCHILTGETG